MSKDAYIASRIILLLLGLVLISSFFVVINAGERGVLMRFGQVQPQVLGEGIHAIVPIANRVQKLSVRVQKQEVAAEASSKDLQDVFIKVALNWHIIPAQAYLVFQQVGNQKAVIERIITPATDEILKAVVAQYTAEEIITKRAEAKAEFDRLLASRLTPYWLKVDDVSLVKISFSSQFGEAVEAKQIAEQEVKRAGFLAAKAVQEAEARTNLARGEAEAQQLIHATLTPELLRKQMVDRWDGRLPMIVGDGNPKLLELELDDLVKMSKK